MYDVNIRALDAEQQYPTRAPMHHTIPQFLQMLQGTLTDGIRKQSNPRFEAGGHALDFEITGRSVLIVKQPIDPATLLPVGNFRTMAGIA
jgi:hypothetical protein